HDDQPATRLCFQRCLMEPLQSLSKRRRADPVDFGREAEGGPSGVHVRIDQTGDHAAALQIDRQRLRPDQPLDIGATSHRDDDAVADGQSFANRKIVVYSDDLPVHQDRIRGLSPGLGRSDKSNASEDGYADHGYRYISHFFAPSDEAVGTTSPVFDFNL